MSSFKLGSNHNSIECSGVAETRHVFRDIINSPLADLGDDPPHIWRPIALEVVNSAPSTSALRILAVVVAGPRRMSLETPSIEQ